MAGTAEKKAGRSCFDQVPKNDWASKRLGDVVIRRRKRDDDTDMIALTWNSGRMSSAVVRRKMSCASEHAGHRLMLAWSSITPLGRPVVPLV